MNYKYILRPDSLWELMLSLRLCSHNGRLLPRGVREGEGPTFKGTQGREGKRGDTEREGNSLKVIVCWWRGTVVERRSLAGELSLSCA